MQMSHTIKESMKPQTSIAGYHCSTYRLTRDGEDTENKEEFE